MKNILVIIALAVFSSVQAQESTHGSSPTDTSSTWQINLVDNTSLSGKILEENSETVIFHDITLGKITIPKANIRSMTRLSADQLCILTTTDGKTFSGILLSQDSNEIKLKTESLGVLTLSNSKIRDIKLIDKNQIINGRYYFSNPHPTRYFFGPTAIALKKGEGYYQNAYVLANSVQVGVSDHFSMGGGIVIPVLFFITPKFGYKIAENLYAGGGVLAATTLSQELVFGIGVGYGSLTVGNNENNFTLSAGWGAVKEEHETSSSGIYPYTTDVQWRMAELPMFSFSGMARIAPKVALVTENWVFSTKKYANYSSTQYTNEYNSVLTFGFRIMGEKNSFDLAVAVPLVEDSTFGIPYLDYVFKF